MACKRGGESQCVYECVTFPPSCFQSLVKLDFSPEFIFNVVNNTYGQSPTSFPHVLRYINLDSRVPFDFSHDFLNMNWKRLTRTKSVRRESLKAQSSLISLCLMISCKELRLQNSHTKAGRGSVRHPNIAARFSCLRPWSWNRVHIQGWWRIIFMCSS